MLSALSSSPPRRLAAQILNFAFVLSTAFMLFKGMAIIADCPSPIVVVLSGSMEPAMQRGDLIMLWNRRDVKVGDVVVYNVKGRDIPIVHRVIKKFGGGVEPLQLLTKGDNNHVDDTELYAPGQRHLDREDLDGILVGYIPYVGYVTIVMNDYPWLKTVMIGLVGLTALLQKD